MILEKKLCTCIGVIDLTLTNGNRQPRWRLLFTPLLVAPTDPVGPYRVETSQAELATSYVKTGNDYWLWDQDLGNGLTRRHIERDAKTVISV